MNFSVMRFHADDLIGGYSVLVQIPRFLFHNAFDRFHFHFSPELVDPFLRARQYGFYANARMNQDASPFKMRPDRPKTPFKRFVRLS